MKIIEKIYRCCALNRYCALMCFIFRYCVYALFLPVYYTSCLIPKKKDIWIFGAWFGEKFADNPKYLFLYVKKKHPEIRAIWLTHNTKVLRDLRRKGYEVYKIYSLKGFLYPMRASCTFLSHCVFDVNEIVAGKSKKILLFHGSPTKKGIYDDANFLATRNRFISKVTYRIFPFLDLVSLDIINVNSDENRLNIASMYRLEDSNVFACGLPRNDAFFDNHWLTANRCDFLDNIRNKLDFRYVFVYLPTWRSKENVDLFEKYNFKVEILERVLDRLNAIFIIKEHHGYGRKSKLPTNKNNLQRIYVLCDDELPDIYPLLKETDILITDYSTVTYDYLLLDRPIIFAPFDIDEYLKEDRELYYNYDEITPGPKAKDWPEVLMLIEEIMQHDRWEQQRDEVCTRFNKFKDGESSKRVFEKITELLDTNS